MSLQVHYSQRDKWIWPLCFLASAPEVCAAQAPPKPAAPGNLRYPSKELHVPCFRDPVFACFCRLTIELK